MRAVSAEDLNEVEFGEWTGVAFSDLEGDPRWRCWNQARSQHAPPGGESMLQVQLRLAGWMSAMSERHPDQDIAAVCHSDVIKAALCHALGLSLDSQYRLAIEPGSISVVVATEQGLTVRSTNEVPNDVPVG